MLGSRAGFSAENKCCGFMKWFIFNWCINMKACFYHKITIMRTIIWNTFISQLELFSQMEVINSFIIVSLHLAFMAFSQNWVYISQQFYLEFFLRVHPSKLEDINLQYLFYFKKLQRKMFYCVVTRKLNSLDISDMLQNTVNSDLWGKSSELGDEFMLH